MLASLTRGELSRLVRRHRRILAAALAGIAALIAVSSLAQGSAAPPPAEQQRLSAGEVAIAITLESQAAAGFVHMGDLVSVVAVSDDGLSSIIAESARVLEPAASGGFGSGESAITLAVDEASALRIAGAPARGTLTVILRPSTP